MEEFCSSLSLDNKEFSEHIFNVFDLNSDKAINFREFILGIANLINERLEYKIRFSFNLIDPLNSGKVKEKDFITYLSSLSKQFVGFHLSEDILTKLVSAQFA